MPARFVSIDHDTPLLLAPNLRDWVPANPLCLFIVDAVEVESLLIVGQRVSDAPNDKEQLVPTLHAIPASVGTVEGV